MRILGIDPGFRGGMSIVEIDNGAPAKIIDTIDIPTVGTGAKTRVDVLAIKKWLETHQPDHAAIERAGVMPKQGIASGYRYGRAVGAIEATVALCEIPLTIVEPSVWKRRMGLYGTDKETGRQKALMLFPTAHALLARKMDHGRAEAALIALAPIHGISAHAEETQPKASISSVSQSESTS
jgi:Holliday junction resolvasome RuvABC endonuclease subunit